MFEGLVGYPWGIELQCISKSLNKAQKHHRTTDLPNDTNWTIWYLYFLNVLNIFFCLFQMFLSFILLPLFASFWASVPHMCHVKFLFVATADLIREGGGVSNFLIKDNQHDLLWGAHYPSCTRVWSLLPYGSASKVTHGDKTVELIHSCPWSTRISSITYDSRTSFILDVRRFVTLPNRGFRVWEIGNLHVVIRYHGEGEGRYQRHTYWHILLLEFKTPLLRIKIFTAVWYFAFQQPTLPCHWCHCCFICVLWMVLFFRAARFNAQ